MVCRSSINATGTIVRMTKRPPLLLPPALKPGDLVGLAAPAGPFPEDRFRAGLSRLEAMGFKTTFPDQIFEQNGFLAGSDQNRAETFNHLVADPNVQAIICARGGYGTMRILDLIDLSPLAQNPKIILGFSDITALLMAIHHQTGLVTFHGPVITSLAEADDNTVRHLQKILTGQPTFPVSLNTDKVIVEGRVEGPLLGGNLTLLVHMLATNKLPDLEDSILFLEDTTEAPYKLDRMLTTLKLSGVLERCRGVLLGDFHNCGEPEEVDAVLKDAFKKFPGPVAAGFPIGHKAANLTLPLGPHALLDTRAGILDIIEPYLA